ncbi:YceI family protein [Hyunsoonleella flava]|uniref:YceI family protein n=1 Tax=Hyunsoonleella flava TaxID=2527939 RepID=A0A4V2JA73_9FLAO|nr:YceI family protein [Hyunsoonleella flava]TBN04415.1 YceI family protein [Hyunsoonleella flava]
MKTYRIIKLLPIITCLLICTISFGQDKYIDKNGTIVFEASEKLFEEVKATNKYATAIYNIETNEIAALALMKGFRFKNSLMEEHFNENYIESDTYPKAIFKGKIVDFNATKNLGETAVEVDVKGVLELHGKQKTIETVLTLQKVDNIISMTGSFVVSPSDFDIEIPKIVRNKIAKMVHVNLDFKLIRK